MFLTVSRPAKKLFSTDIFSYTCAPTPMSGNTGAARAIPHSDQHSPRGQSAPLHIQNKSMGSSLLHPESLKHGHDHDREHDHDDHTHRQQEQAVAERLANKAVELER